MNFIRDHNLIVPSEVKKKPKHKRVTNDSPTCKLTHHSSDSRNRLPDNRMGNRSVRVPNEPDDSEYCETHFRFDPPH